MDKERMAELEKIEAHGAENGWVAPMTEEGREFFAYFRSVFKRYNKITLRVIVDQQDLFVFICKSSSKIQCCCSLTNTTLRVGDRYYSVFPHIYYS